MRLTDAGGRLEVISAKEGGAGLMRTAEVVIVDELRVFHMPTCLASWSTAWRPTVDAGA